MYGSHLPNSTFNRFTMAPFEVISLRESLPTDTGEREAHDIEQDTSNLEQANSRQWDSSGKRARVLVGSAILQLPIWGRLSLAS